MNHYLSGLYSNISQILLCWYTHRGDRRHQYLWVSCSLYDAFFYLPFGEPIKLTGGRFTTGTGLYSSVISFVNRTTGRRSAPYFTISKCDAKGTYVDAFSVSFSLHDSVEFLYRGIISHSHIILSGCCHITDW